jgi:hypothetical protein
MGWLFACSGLDLTPQKSLEYETIVSEQEENYWCLLLVVGTDLDTNLASVPSSVLSAQAWTVRDL